MAAVCAAAWLNAAPAKDEIPKRIVSLAPSVTETLFALNLGNRVVGVTRYCQYPPEADALPEIGGYITPNYEALAALQPDLAIVLPEHEEVAHHVRALGIDVLRIDARTVQGVLDGIRLIGERCGVPQDSERLLTELQDHLNAVAHVRSGRRSPRVLLCMGRSRDRGGLREIHSAAAGSIHHDLLVLAGGENVVPAGPSPYPTLSAEGLLHLNPEVVVDFATGEKDSRAIRDGWKGFSSVDAVRNGRVIVFTQDFLSIPGPRLIRFVEELARTIDPEAPWKK